MWGGLKPATTTFRGVPADLLISFCEARPDMWHKVRVTTRGGSKKARYISTFREGVESVAVFKDVHGGALKVRNHMRLAKKSRADARVEQHVKRGAHGGVRMTDMGDIVFTLYPQSLIEVKEEPYRGRGSKLKVVKGTVYVHTGVNRGKGGHRPPKDPSAPKVWPFLPTFDDLKAHAMRELHALCEAHFMHLVGLMDDSDALRYVLG
eukprot:jgi/Tetstr1/432160/TSEL_021617.t1